MVYRIHLNIEKMAEKPLFIININILSSYKFIKNCTIAIKRLTHGIQYAMFDSILFHASKFMNRGGNNLNDA